MHQNTVAIYIVDTKLPTEARPRIATAKQAGARTVEPEVAAVAQNDESICIRVSVSNWKKMKDWQCT